MDRSSGAGVEFTVWHLLSFLNDKFPCKHKKLYLDVKFNKDSTELILPKLDLIIDYRKVNMFYNKFIFVFHIFHMMKDKKHKIFSDAYKKIISSYFWDKLEFVISTKIKLLGSTHTDKVTIFNVIVISIYYFGIKIHAKIFEEYKKSLDHNVFLQAIIDDIYNNSFLTIFLDKHDLYIKENPIKILENGEIYDFQTIFNKYKKVEETMEDLILLPQLEEKSKNKKSCKSKDRELDVEGILKDSVFCDKEYVCFGENSSNLLPRIKKIKTIKDIENLQLEDLGLEYKSFSDIQSIAFKEINLEDGKSEKKYVKNYKKNIYVNTFESIEGGATFNIDKEEDFCPICHDKWNDDDILVVLMCGHAYCLKCAISLYTSNKDNKDTIKKEKTRCSLCRKIIKGNLVTTVFQQIIKHNLYNFISIYKNILNFNNEDYLKFISKLFIKNDFNIAKINDILYNIASLVFVNENEYRLTAQRKTEIFNEARQPLNMVYTEIKDLKDQIQQVQNNNQFNNLNQNNKFNKISQMENEEIIKALEEEIEHLYSKAEALKKLIPKQIYSTINSDNFVRSNTENYIYVDLHSLFVNEAINILQEFVIPFLTEYKCIYVITGKGNHTNGNSKLKIAVVEFLAENKINYSIKKNNEGVLVLTN